MKIETIKKMASYVGLLLALVSMIFTCKLLVSFAGNGAEKLIYIIFGIAIQSAQTLAYIYACFCIWKGHPAKAIPGLTLFCILFLLSLAGTIGFFSVTNKAQIESTTATDEHHQLLKNRITQLENQIETTTAGYNSQITTVNQQIADYTSKNMLTKGVNPAREQLASLINRKETALKELQAQREQAIKDYTAYKAVPISDALYEMIGNFFGVSDTYSVKMVIYTMYAVALDLASVILLAYSIGLLDFVGSSEGSSGGLIRRKRAYEDFYEDGFSPVIAGGREETRRPPNKKPQVYSVPVSNVNYELGSGTPGVEIKAPRPANLGNINADSGNDYEMFDEPLYSRVAVAPEKHNDGVKRNYQITPADSGHGENPVKYNVSADTPVKADTDTYGTYVPTKPNRSTQSKLSKENTGNTDTEQADTSKRSTMGLETDDKPIELPKTPIKSDNDKVTIGQLKAYITELFPTPPRDDQSLVSRRVIADKIGISQRQADLCHRYLKDSALVTVAGTRTYANCSQPDMINAVNTNHGSQSQAVQYVS